MPTVLAIDPGQDLGYALFKNKKPVAYDTIKFRNHIKSRRIWASLLWIIKMVIDEQVDVIVVERPYKIFRNAVALGVLFDDILALTDTFSDVKCVTYTPTAWRKIIGIKTKKNPKEETIKKIKTQYKIKLARTKHDTADALGLGFAYLKGQK